MAQRKFNVEWSEQTGAPVRAASQSAMSVQSPARLLQQLLEEHKAANPEPQIERWSDRRALAFMVVSASALWVAILVAGAQAAKALA